MANWIESLANDFRTRREAQALADAARKPVAERAAEAYERLKKELMRAVDEVNASIGEKRFEARELGDGNLVISRANGGDAIRVGMLQDGLTMHSHRAGNFVPPARMNEQHFRVVPEPEETSFQVVSPTGAGNNARETKPITLDEVVRRIAEPFFRESLGLKK